MPDETEDEDWQCPDLSPGYLREYDYDTDLGDESELEFYEWEEWNWSEASRQIFCEPTVSFGIFNDVSTSPHL